MANLHIQLLGEFQLIYDDAVLTTVNQARHQALLAYLLLHRYAPQSRQHLAFIFWPDTSESQALTNLRNLLYKLRQALPTPDRFLFADTQTIQWRVDAPFTLDVVEFETALEPATTRIELETAVNLYRGDLLPSCYDDWIRPMREALHQQALTALERLVKLLEDERNYRSAIAYGQRLLQLDLLNENTYRTLMHLHAVIGDRAGALHLYQACAALLQDELGVEPARATQELYTRLLANDTMPPSHDPAYGTEETTLLSLIGRTNEWQILLNSWHRANAGIPHCLLVTGEAGIGKTRLAEELVTWTRRQGFLTAGARCYAVEGALAYAPVVAWLRSERLRSRWSALDPVWLTELARLLPEVRTNHPNLPPSGPLTEGWQRQRLFDALARAVLAPAAVASTQDTTVLLFLDDLQWCDQDTLAWLHYLLRYGAQVGLLIVGTVRTEEVLDDHPLLAWLAELRRDNFVMEMALERLTEPETTALADQLTTRVLTATERAQLYQATEGNPLFVVESVRVLSGQVPVTPTLGQRIGTWARGELATPVAGLPLPPTVQAVIGHRLEQLSAPARALVGLAATIGRELSLDILLRAGALTDEQLVDQLDELCAHRILRETGNHGYDFTHDRLREVAYGALSTARRHLYHRRVAEALVTAGAATVERNSAQIAAHFALAGDHEQAIHHYQRAAHWRKRSTPTATRFATTAP
ncbi:MAG: AAA family ATPase [Caldilineaceae bacterium]